MGTIQSRRVIKRVIQILNQSSQLSNYFLKSSLMQMAEFINKKKLSIMGQLLHQKHTIYQNPNRIDQAGNRMEKRLPSLT